MHVSKRGRSPATPAGKQPFVPGRHMHVITPGAEARDTVIRRYRGSHGRNQHPPDAPSRGVPGRLCSCRFAHAVTASCPLSRSRSRCSPWPRPVVCNTPPMALSSHLRLPARRARPGCLRCSASSRARRVPGSNCSMDPRTRCSPPRKPAARPHPPMRLRPSPGNRPAWRQRRPYPARLRERQTRRGRQPQLERPHRRLTKTTRHQPRHLRRQRHRRRRLPRPRLQR